MSIEIYDKAEVIRKGEKYYFLLKSGSKNSYTCGRQYIIDGNFRPKFIRRDSRDSTWHVIAVGDKESYISRAIAKTYWNAPTSEVYGAIRFGNKKNIALWLAKRTARDYAVDFDEAQRAKIDEIIGYSNAEYIIDLTKPIPAGKGFKMAHDYCGKQTLLIMGESAEKHGGIIYWSLDNL